MAGLVPLVCTWERDRGALSSTCNHWGIGQESNTGLRKIITRNNIQTNGGPQFPKFVPKFVSKFLFPNSMKTASLGLLEVMVVRVNAGGDAPPDPPSVVSSRAHPPFFVFSRKDFRRIKANERDNIFGEGVKNYKKGEKILLATDRWVRESYYRQETKFFGEWGKHIFGVR